MLTHTYPAARETALPRCTFRHIRIPYEGLNRQTSCRPCGNALSVNVFFFCVFNFFPRPHWVEWGSKTAKIIRLMAVLCAARDYKGAGSTSHPPWPKTSCGPC